MKYYADGQQQLTCFLLRIVACAMRIWCLKYTRDVGSLNCVLERSTIQAIVETYDETALR